MLIASIEERVFILIAATEDTLSVSPILSASKSDCLFINLLYLGRGFTLISVSDAVT